MNVLFTKTAVSHLDGIFKYIAQNSPAYAKKVVDRITRRSEQIALFPFSGRKVPEMDTDRIREIIEGSFRIIYYLKPNRIEILAVIHGSHTLPKALNRPQ
jgi:toxin ParE1/3/4